MRDSRDGPGVSAQQPMQPPRFGPLRVPQRSLGLQKARASARLIASPVRWTSTTVRLQSDIL